MANLQRNQWIGGTLKSANRLRQIVAVFAKHGFQNIVEELELGKYFFLEKIFIPLFCNLENHTIFPLDLFLLQLKALGGCMITFSR